MLFRIGVSLWLFNLYNYTAVAYPAPRVCPLVNLPPIKRAGPTALSPIPPKT